jgi:hypothetical protein
MANKLKQKKNENETMLTAKTSLPAPVRLLLTLLLPFVLTLFLEDRGNNALVLGSLGVVSWFFGLFWYGLSQMGLRGGRPLFAGIGFATVGWLALLLFRFYFIPLNLNAVDSGRSFVFLLLFEAFAVQLWTFGLLFRGMAEWRGPLMAAFGSGIAFGSVAFILFQEAVSSDIVSLLYFGVWGLFYGIIRLRTGSLLGSVVIQTLHSFTVWVALGPPPASDSKLQTVYLLTAFVYALLIWRLWPKEEADYRV